jgi:hypothetical protein
MWCDYEETYLTNIYSIQARRHVVGFGSSVTRERKLTNEVEVNLARKKTEARLNVISDNGVPEKILQSSY